MSIVSSAGRSRNGLSSIFVKHSPSHRILLLRWANIWETISYLQNIFQWQYLISTKYLSENIISRELKSLIQHSVIVPLPGQPYLPGIYVDQKTGCQVENRLWSHFQPDKYPQVFYMCELDGRQTGFLCPNGTIFSQKYFVCDWWYWFSGLFLVCDMFPSFRYNIDCDRQADYLHMNKFLYPEKEGKYNIPCCSAVLVNVV